MTVNAITDTKKRENRDCAYLSSYYPTYHTNVTNGKRLTMLLFIYYFRLFAS